MFHHTPLHLAVQTSEKEIIKLLLDHKETEVNIVDKIFIDIFIRFEIVFLWYFYEFMEKTS